MTDQRDPSRPHPAISITIKLFGPLRSGRFQEEQRVYPLGTTCHEVMQDLAIGQDDPGLLLINGRPAKPERAVQDGDILSVLPLVGGG